MPLDIANTVLISSPYFDDYSEAKNFHRVLFRPAVAVQARELSQLQTILQNQIERFGNHLFKDGSVVKGCSVEYIKDLEYVGVADQFTDVPSLAVSDPSLIGAVVVGQTSKVQAQVIAARPGFIRQNKPNRFFVRYTNPGANNERTFQPGEELAFYNESGSYVENVVLTVANAQPFAAAMTSSGVVVDSVQIGNTGNVLGRALAISADANNNTVVVHSVTRRFNANTALTLRGNNQVSTLITAVDYNLSTEVGRINVLTTPTTDGVPVTPENVSGFAYGAYVSDGIIYQKGHFIRVDDHNVIVNEDSNNPAGYMLGFVTEESIVTETADSSLYDNALGYANFNAPGAHRLKLTATAVSRAANSISNTEIFFPIAEFSNTGAIYERTDPQYAALGDEIAKRTYEESGHYIVSPFGISSNTDPGDTNGVIYDIAPGLAYVKGFRTELMSNLPVKGRRGTNTASYSEQIVTMAIGNYVDVKEIRGYFPTDTGASVVLYDTVQGAVSNNYAPTSAMTGNAIGSANIMELNWLTGAAGAPDSESRMYLFNVKMNSNAYSFARDVKSVVYSPNTTHRAFADLVSNTGLKESTYSTYIFSLGAKAVKSLRNEFANTPSDNNFYYNSANTALNVALDTTGKINFRVPGGGGILGFTTTSETDEKKVDIVLMSNTISSGNIATASTSSNATLNANGLVIASGIGSLVFPGEGIAYGANVHRVTSVINTNAIMVSGIPVAVPALTNQTLKRFHYAGAKVPIDGALRTITVNANNEATADLGLTYPSNTAAYVRMYSLQNSGAELKKEIRRSTIVIVDPNTDGPWNLGIPDVISVRGVYKAANASVADDRVADMSKNYANKFVFDNGQRDNMYDHATLNWAPGIDRSEFLGANTYLLVEMDHFVANTPGAGFFSVDSYPVDDSITADTAATIATSEIPAFYSVAQSKRFDLRDSIDFRPYKAATANTDPAARSNIKLCTLSPATTNTFNPLTTTFKPYPGQNFECDFTHYLGRRDAIVITPAGEFRVVEGSSSIAPRSPQPPVETLTVATIEVPPYPSLPDNERKFYNRSDFGIKISVQNQRRFTMKDIGAIEQRVSRLEYYTSLNALEKAAADLKVPGTNGLDRFKNGIFVDPLNSHAFGRVELPQYKIAIDEKNGFARPFFKSEFFELDFVHGSKSPGTRRVGSMVVLDYDEVDFLDQGFATSSRKLSGAPPSYQGTLVLSPNRWTEIETGASPVSVNVVNKASQAIQNMTIPPLSATYGWWRTEKTDTDSRSSGRRYSSSPTERLRDKVNISTEATYSVDAQTERSVSIQSYIKPREVAFRAYGLKPYTTHILYIDDIDQTLRAAPGTINDRFSLDEMAVNREAMWGTEITTNSRGECAGVISLPAMTYKIGRHTVKLISQEIDAITREQTSSAGALFEADVIYVAPPPPIVVEPPPPPPPDPVIVVEPPPLPPDAPEPPLPPPPPPVIQRGPTAKFSTCGCYMVVAPNNHSVTFTDQSTPGSSAIVNWHWDFGDGTTYSVNNTPPAHNYTANDCGVEYTATLTVTDANGLKSSFSKTFVLFKLPAPPPTPKPKPLPPGPGLPPLPPPAPDSSVVGIETTSGNVIIGSGVVTGVGSVEAAHRATTSKTFAGAYFQWYTNTLSSTGAGRVDSASGAVLSQSLTNGAGPESESVMEITATYQYANGFAIGSQTIGFTMIASNKVSANTTAPSGGGTSGGAGTTGSGGTTGGGSRRGGGGCVTVDTIIKGFGRAGDVQVGDELVVVDPVTLEFSTDIVTYSEAKMQPAVRIKTESGVVLECSRTAPISDIHGNQILAPDLLGHLIPIVSEEDGVSYEYVTEVSAIEDTLVQHITVGNKFFPAAAESGAYILHHNVKNDEIYYGKYYYEYEQ